MSSSAERWQFPRTPGTLALNLALRELRDEQGIPVRELARDSGYGASAVSSFENNRLPPFETVARLLGFLRVGRAGYDSVLELAREAPSPTFVEHCDDLRRPLTAVYEACSAVITEWAPRLIPEKFRAPGYARVLSTPTLSDPELLDRQMFERLCRSDAVMPDSNMRGWYTLLLSEAALRPAAVNAADMLEQLQHLQEVGRSHRIAVRLVPESGWRPDLTSARVLYAADMKLKQAVVVLPQGDTNIYLGKPSDIGRHKAILDAIEEKALYRKKTRDTIAAMIDELRAAAPDTDRAAPEADGPAATDGPPCSPVPANARKHEDAVSAGTDTGESNHDPDVD